MKGRRLRALRTGKLWTIEKLAELSGIGARTIRRYETSAGASVLPEPIGCVAKALGVDVSEIASGDPDRAAASRKRTADEPAAAPPREAAPSKSSRLEQLAALESRRKPPPSRVGPGGRAAPLTAARLQDLFTAYRVYEGERFYVHGRVEAQRGVAGAEARLLDSKNGVAARFHLVWDVTPRERLGVTVHTQKAEHTRALQALHRSKQPARVFCRVCAAEASPERDKPWFTHFATEKPRPWTLAVEGVEDG